MASGKPVLVFDLDDTLIYTSVRDSSTIDAITINIKLLSIIYKAKEMGCKILLLTNNRNGVYTYKEKEGRFVDIACSELLIAYHAIESTCKPRSRLTKRIFDRILTAEKTEERTYNHETPVKSLVDVRHMLNIDGPIDTRKIFFFDDLATHELCKQSTFIQITPPFNVAYDETDYSPILSALRRIERGTMKRKLKESHHGM
jgi:hypothetical protein